jgi:hypothetical protein
MRRFTVLNVTRPEGGHVSEQERNDEQTQSEEQVQDLDVSEEQQDDVTGGARRTRGPSDARAS